MLGLQIQLTKTIENNYFSLQQDRLSLLNIPTMDQNSQVSNNRGEK